MGEAGKRYIFWLNWRKDIESQAEIVKCLVDAEKLLIITEPPFSLPLQRIAECRAVWSGRYASVVELVVWGEKESSIRLMPVNPFYPAGSVSNSREARALMTVISGLKSGAKLALDPDPYKRQLKYNKRWVKAGDTYDANVSPMIYYRARLEPSLRKAYFVLGAIGVMMFIPALIVLIIQRFSGLFR